MKLEITLHGPNCHSTNIQLPLRVKNGKKSYKNRQHFLCKDWGRQFVGDMFLDYLGCHSQLWDRVKTAFVRGCGIRDIAAIFSISIGKVLSLLVEHQVHPLPKQQYYDELEVDEFWSYVGNKKSKVWLIYVYHRSTGEIVAWVFGNRNLLTAKKLKHKLADLGVSFGSLCMDNWDSFKTAFEGCNVKTGKYWTKGLKETTALFGTELGGHSGNHAISPKR